MKVMYDKQITIKNDEGYFSGVDFKTGELFFDKKIENCMMFYVIDDLIEYLGAEKYKLELMSTFEIVGVTYFHNESE